MRRETRTIIDQAELSCVIYELDRLYQLAFRLEPDRVVRLEPGHTKEFVERYVRRGSGQRAAVRAAGPHSVVATTEWTETTVAERHVTYVLGQETVLWYEVDNMLDGGYDILYHTFRDRDALLASLRRAREVRDTTNFRYN